MIINLLVQLCGLYGIVLMKCSSTLVLQPAPVVLCIWHHQGHSSAMAHFNVEGH